MTSVLLVDDERDLLSLLDFNLRAAGFETLLATSGDQALSQLRRRVPDLVLLDVMLPDVGGHEVGRRIASDRATRDLPVVFISARTHVDDLRAGYEAGAVDYITKPFDPTALPARVRATLGRVERGESERFRLARLAELRR